MRLIAASVSSSAPTSRPPHCFGAKMRRCLPADIGPRARPRTSPSRGIVGDLPIPKPRHTLHTQIGRQSQPAGTAVPVFRS